MFTQFDPEHICLGCMTDQQKEGSCPHCGFDAAGYEAPQHQLRPGSILNGKYLVGRRLDEDGFDISYIGFDLNLGLRVTIREYYPQIFVSRQASFSMSVVTPSGVQEEQYHRGLERFLHEAGILAKFHNLNGIISVKDFFAENATAYMVTEYMEGETLKQYLAQKGGRLPMEETLALLRPVVELLTLVHNACVIHRDIGSDNIVITKTGAKLIHFGASRMYMCEYAAVNVLLKTGYAPLEQYQNHGELGPWTDVYALCATIYRCVTGETPPGSVERLLDDTLTTPLALGAALAPFQQDALLKGLSVKARDRYQDIPQLVWALQNGPPPPSLPPMKPVLLKLAGWALMVLGAALLLKLLERG